MDIDLPIIFLDFDGVVETIYWDKAEDGVVSLNAHQYGHSELSNKQAIGWLNELYSKVPYNIVVSSTWRIGMSKEGLQKLLTNSGFNPKIKVIGITPILHQQRGLEIQQWIDDNDFKGKFIIVDDDCDMCHLMPFLIRCDSLLGFTIYDYQKALKMLS